MPSRQVFNQELKRLNEEVVLMARTAREAIETGVRAFVNRDPGLADRVSELDEELYQLDLRIEKRSLEVIALHTPVARDLRTVSTCLKIITDLNRIGRYALNIAEFSREIEETPHQTRLVNILHMAELSVGMVTDAVDSFVKRDADKAKALYERDEEVDELWDSISSEVIAHMLDEPRRITMGTYYILVARYLERIADHATNISDRVVYMVEAVRVKRK
ncbi:MAG: phosphate signaling complex protein PhoU [Methanomassiliicoccales archaeon]